MMLFLGAGASKPFGIKTLEEIEKEFEKTLKDGEVNEELRNERFLYQMIKLYIKEPTNIEDILTVLNSLSKLPEDPTARYLYFLLNQFFDLYEREIDGYQKLIDELLKHEDNIVNSLQIDPKFLTHFIQMKIDLRGGTSKSKEVSTPFGLEEANTKELLKSKRKELLEYRKEAVNRNNILTNYNIAKKLRDKLIVFIRKNCTLKEEEKRLTDIYRVYKRLFKILKFNPCAIFDIFTTNYDLVIEKYHEHHFTEEYDYSKKSHFFSYNSRISFTDGFLLRTFEDNCLTFKDEFDDNVWDPKKYDDVLSNDNSEDIPTLRLFKLHGSIDQYIERDKIVKRDILYPTPTASGEERLESMIYPMREKEVYKDTFFELFTRLKTNLLSEKICIVIGYSFGDEHIRNIFFDAVKRNPEIRIFMISPNAKKIRDDLEPIKHNIEPIEGKFGEEEVFEELKQKLSEV